MSWSSKALWTSGRSRRTCVRAATPAAGAFTALGILLAALLLTPLLYFLPKATLAATIVVSLSLAAGLVTWLVRLLSS